ncbi:MAG TPA: porin family protein [bacterium]|nr:porin family protein [bacterium]
MRLKVLLMALAFMSLTAVQVFAQHFELGLESGMNFSYFVGSDANNLSSNSISSSRLGFVGGGFLCLNFGPNFGIRPEVLYEQKGAQVSGTSINYEADYIEVPVLLKFSLGLPGLNPSVLIGPSFDWATLSSLPSNSGVVNSADVGAVAGLEFDLGPLKLNGRYELGLDNVTNNKNLQNGVFTVLMGYSFI